MPEGGEGRAGARPDARVNRGVAWASVQQCPPKSSSDGPSIYIWLRLRQVDWHRVRVGLVVALVIIFAGVVIDSLFSASWLWMTAFSWRRPQSSRWRSS